ncbi:hypothetical protein INR49_019547 [Caranx melampygus]|nr:hypothetical protein INR49_019547 [Caranx melampygus]
MSRPPPLVMSAVVSGIQSPFAGCREEEEEEGFVCSCCGSIQPDSHYLHPQRRTDWNLAAVSLKQPGQPYNHTGALNVP